MDFQKWFEIFNEVIARAGISPLAQTWIFRVLLVFLIIYGIIWFLAKVFELLKPFMAHIRLPSSKDKREYIKRRQKFAKLLEYEIKRINELEEWSDYRFTELEAEVEAEGGWTSSTLIPFQKRRRKELHREPSLTPALHNSDERLILLQGDPGAGKSAALRHIAAQMTQLACTSRNTKTVIPFYINLKELHRTPGQEIDHHLIRSFVLGSLNRLKNQEIDAFLSSEFDCGIRTGTWLFLFDSFDEIPEVLSSTNADQNVQAYSAAISDFLNDQNLCRGIIASRDYRGPQYLGWPRFTILGLTYERRLRLIQNSGLNSEAEQELLVGISDADEAMSTMSANPLFLDLLCDQVRHGQPFPKNVHMVFETYITTRLERDQKRIEAAFDVQPKDIREVAEQVGFVMSMDAKLGLSSDRDQLRDALRREKFTIHRHFGRALDALESIKLAHTNEVNIISAEKTFTFAHRRFQEYFAACIVLRNPERVSPRELLLNGRWRETTVTLLQTRPLEDLQYLVEEAERLTDELLGGVEGLIDDPLVYVENETKKKGKREIHTISLPDKIYHLFGLLQAGLGRRVNQLPDSLVMQASRVVLTANEHSPLYEEAQALSVAGIIYEPVLHWVLEDALNSPSKSILDIAFQQTAYLHSLPNDIYQIIKKVLISSRRSDYYTLLAYSKRLPPNRVIGEILRLKSTKGKGIIERVLGIYDIGILDDRENSDSPINNLSLLSFAFLLLFILTFSLLIYSQPSLLTLIVGSCILIFLFFNTSIYMAYLELLYKYDHILGLSRRPFAPLICLVDYMRSEGFKALIREKFLKPSKKLMEDYKKIPLETREIITKILGAYAFVFVIFLIGRFLRENRYFPLLFQYIESLNALLTPFTTPSTPQVARLVASPTPSSVLPAAKVMPTIGIFYKVFAGTLCLYCGLPIFLPLIFRVPWILYYQLRDRYSLEWCKRAEQKELYIKTFPELHEILCDFSTAENILIFLNLVRINQLVSPDAGMMDGLAGLSLKVEELNQHRAEAFTNKEPIIGYFLSLKKYLSKISDLLEYNKYYHTHEPTTGLMYSALNNKTIELIEELNLLLNQIRAYKKD